MTSVPAEGVSTATEDIWTNGTGGGDVTGGGGGCGGGMNLTCPADLDFVFEFFLPGILLNCVGALGLVGNLISIFILSRPQMKGSTNCILIGLATYDIILILSR